MEDEPKVWSRGTGREWVFIPAVVSSARFRCLEPWPPDAQRMRRGIISHSPKRSPASSSLLHTSVDLAWQTIHGRGLQLGVLAQPDSSSRGYPTVRRLCSAAIGAATAGRGLLCPDADWAALLCHGQSHGGSRWELRGLRHAHRRHRHSDLLCNIHLAAPPHKRRSLLSPPTWQLHGVAHARRAH